MCRLKNYFGKLYRFFFFSSIKKRATEPQSVHTSLESLLKTATTLEIIEKLLTLILNDHYLMVYELAESVGNSEER